MRIKLKLIQRFKIGTLQTKMLIPLLIFLIVCTYIIIRYSRHAYTKHLKSHALVRCQQQSHSIGVCAQIVHYPYELQRLVSVFSSEAHIRTIAILWDDPLTVLACNRSTLVGKKWKTYPLPRGVRLPNFPQEQETYDFLPKRHVFSYAMGFYLLQYVNNSMKYVPAYVVIQLDTYYWHKEFMRQNLAMVSISLCILLSLAMICLWQINRWVIRPLMAIKRQINKRRLGNLYAMAPILHNDEIGELAKTLNEMIRSQEKTENLFHKVIDIAPFLLWTTNEDNTNFYFNKQWCKFTGQNYFTYHDWSWLSYMTNGTAQRYQAIFLEAQKERKSIHFECRLKDNLGKEHWMLCQCVPQILSDGHFEGYISCLVDISERKKSEKKLANYAEKLAKARDEALQSMQAKSTFLATMSHEIRTPINGILGFTYLLQDTPLNAEQKDYVKTINSSTQLLLDLINQILDLSKIEAKKLTLEPINFHLDTCIKEVCDIFQPTLVKKNLNLSVWIHPHIEHWLVGDVKRLRQILINLISNAIKFTSSGSIFIRATGRKLEQDNYQLFISVKDQGTGISQNDIHRIFEAFEQVSYQNQGGTGLGLPITQSLVQLMNGTLKVHSKLEQGSIFFFSVFLKCGHPENNRESNELSTTFAYKNIQPEQPKPCLLLVEDNIDNQQVAQKILEKNGYEVVTVSNGIQCLDWLEKNTTCLIIMDINMPQMDGFETTQRIRSGICGLEKAAIPILGFTANALKQTYDQAISVGMNAILPKPLQPDQLLKQIDKIISNTH